ncbi:MULTISPECIES: glutathione peroxidase [Micrococcaceae]|uniref:glutathione peroxidase n=1 Tax=Micrococcaceae TaxID=1268 RepID=UPI002AA8675B|nr:MULTISPECIES: glutathione peroxidase [Pseudarthrobacter]MEA3551766.1 glutathione peroxidase [Pseudarthrobacter sp. C1]WPU09996.1 glutathione peroxidase [Pseudarthrobacter oxydans]HET7781677.1 glutathione peroxidase [Arthrobacter sp.]
MDNFLGKPPVTDLYRVPLTLNDGSPTDFGRFKGKVVMVVNVASNCGFTPQYTGLETLYQKFRDRGFEVLGVPCNQFAGQEPGSDSEIAEFCQRNFGVTFPLTLKADVRGRNQHPLYAELTKFKSGLLPGLVKWNFEKFLVNRDGQVVNRFAPTVEPDSAEVIDAVEEALC